MAPAAPPHPAPCRVPSRSRLSTSVLKRVRPRVPPLRTLASTPEATPRAPAPPGAAAPRHSRPGSPPSAPVCALGTGSYTVCTRTCKPTPQTHAQCTDHTRAHSPGPAPCTPHTQSRHLQPRGARGHSGQRLAHGRALTSGGVSGRGGVSSSSVRVSRAHPQRRPGWGRQQAAGGVWNQRRGTLGL